MPLQFARRLRGRTVDESPHPVVEKLGVATIDALTRQQVVKSVRAALVEPLVNDY